MSAFHVIRHGGQSFSRALASIDDAKLRSLCADPGMVLAAFRKLFESVTRDRPSSVFGSLRFTGEFLPTHRQELDAVLNLVQAPPITCLGSGSEPPELVATLGKDPDSYPDRVGQDPGSADEQREEKHGSERHGHDDVTRTPNSARFQA